MPLRWRKRSQRPLSAFVEDEIDSLSRELNGTSHLGELPGFEGTKARGTVNQYPVLIDVEIPIHSETSSDVGESLSTGSQLSGSPAGPATPSKDTRQEPIQNPVRHQAGENQPQGPEKPRPRSPSESQDAFLSTQPLHPARKPVPEGGKRSPASKIQTAPPSPSVPSDEGWYRSYTPTVSLPKPVPEMPQRREAIPLQHLSNPSQEGPRMSTSTAKRSRSVKRGPSHRSSPVDSRLTTPENASDTVVKPRHGSTTSDQTSTAQTDRNSPSSPGLSVAERLEEKLKRRREQHPFIHSADPNSPVSKNPEGPIAPAQLPGAWPSDLQPAAAAAAAPLKSALRSRSLDRTQSASDKQTRRRTVSFAEKPLELPSQALVKVHRETALTTAYSRQDGSPDSSRSSSPITGLTLTPCPRSVPVAGYQDWHTLRGLEHLDLCPSCVKQMRKSRFRDRLILSAPRPRTEPVRCAMSDPWVRLAWMQILKKNLDGRDLLLQITLPPAGTKSCTGQTVSEQYWYRITDPETGVYLPQFNVCSACIRNIRLLMPAHRQTFERSGTRHERVCDLVTDSPRFSRYIDALDLSANRAEQENAQPDLTEFFTYVRRKVALRDCRRSRLIFSTWHYMPHLPQFTVCEDCYDDVIWPLMKARYPIAREFSPVLRLLPGDKGSSSREASCQLYSPRIRAKFTEAVRRDDMAFIEWMALTRFDAEKRFRDRQDALLEDQRLGYDRTGDLLKNLEDWKRYE
ncbi:hypothetical protein BJX61DRAFT_530937 [Aspergillus egyptiacus]|nr:hypothetical protein BJX61DRAFT_530937 [Aspergillus egyptiacus]